MTWFFILAAMAANPEMPEDRLRNVIVSNGCYANYKPDPKVVDHLLRIEQAAGFPDAARGLLVAAACNESGFQADAMGDWYDIRTRKRCKNNTPGCLPKSLGMLQFQGWAKKRIRRFSTSKDDPRFDWVASATYWSRHVARQVPRVIRECGYPNVADIWRAAHKTAITRPKCGRYRHRNGKQVCVKRIPHCHKVGSKVSPLGLYRYLS